MQPDDPNDVPSNVTPISKARRARKLRAQSSPHTELDLSERIVNAYGGSEIRYCAALGGWHVWTGTHWERDHLERARECAKQMARDLAIEAGELLDDDAFKAAKRAGSAGGVAAVLDLARSASGVVFRASDADRDPWLLNCANGTLDMRTMELHPHRREDLITRVCRAAYDPNAEAPTFERFMAEIQPDPEVRSYLARLCGYSGVGLVREHILGVFWGPGANGKSVLADCVTHVLGGYSKPGPSSLIVSDGSTQHPTDVASLLGARLVLMHETRRGASFDASKIKLLTGGDKLTARHLYQDFFEFTPSHTLLMLSNYRPAADATDAALWRRVQLVNFDVTIPVERRDPLLAEKIKGEAAGVLRWLVEGAREWQRIGLAPPAVVLEQTERYRSGEDTIGQFLEERTVRLAGTSTKASALYEGFRAWCECSGQRAVCGKDFAAEIVARGFERVELRLGRVYKGIGLKAEGSDEP